MKDSIKNRKKNLLALCLATLMLTSTAAFAACQQTSDDSSSSSSSSTTEEKDTGLIQNAGFETFTEGNRINTSVTGWGTVAVDSDTNGSATKSKAASGIIDLDADEWADLTTSKYTATDAQDAKANWSKMTVKDKLAFYDKWKDENSGKTISTELKDFYEAFNINTRDLPTIANPETHDGAVAAEGDDKDTKVLMIHNQNPDTTTDAIGTAQKFSSSSTVTVKAGTSAKFSVWVKTVDLECEDTDGNKQEAVNKGAYISVTHSVGGTSLDAYKIENINTQTMGVTDDNGWKQYEFYLRGASYADTTFSLVLGLGQGSSSYHAEYVNGYAFFDDITCEMISNDDYPTDIQNVVGFDDEGDEKVVNAYTSTQSKFGMDFHGAFTADADAFTASNITVAETTGEVGVINKVTYTSNKDNNPAPWLNGGFAKTDDVTEVLSGGVAGKAATAGESSLMAQLSAEYFGEEKDPYKAQPTLLLFSYDGVAYQANSNKAFAIPAKEYRAYSFFVKTSEMGGKTGAGITLKVDSLGGEPFDLETAFTAIDTTTATPVEIDGQDINYGWQQYIFFVENTTDKEAELSFTFNYGPTKIETATKDSHGEGFAAFTNFETLTMKKEAFQSAQSGTYSKVLSISDEEETTAADGFDKAMGTPTDALETGLANLQNYKGVYSNSQYMTGTLNASTSYNDYENAGLLSKEEFSKYFDNPENLAWLDGIKAAALAIDPTATTAEKVWEVVFGNDSSLPLLIWNDGSDAQLANAYGYFGTSTSLSANAYTAVSVRVKGTAGAKAYIRMVDTNDDDYANLTAYNQVLSVGRNLTYWYDNDGNVYNGNPDDETKPAFKLQTNGLYKANKNWSGYANLTAAQKDAYFANLNAYANADGTLPQKDLTVADGGTQHDYTNAKNNVAFYYKDGKYYADSAKTIEVLNFASLSESVLKPRYAVANSANYLLEESVTLNGEWQYVTFYIHTGDVAKDYRLEVFSGYKDGNAIKANGADTYVVFDTTNPGTAEDNFTGLMEEYKDTDKVSAKLEGVFSYYDAATYLRYDESLDTENVGNLYKENYTAIAQVEGVAFLKYVDGNEYATFADYTHSEKTITASAVEEDTEDSSSSSEDTEEPNVWLLASSLAVAGVLLLAIISIVVQKLVARSRKKAAAQNSPKPKK